VDGQQAGNALNHDRALKQKKESSKMSLLLISGPAMEPVSLAEAKAHLRIDGSTEDTLVASLITSARVHIETTLSQSLITQQWALWLDEWPDGGEVKLPLTPVQEVVSITIYDSADTGEIVAPEMSNNDIFELSFFCFSAGLSRQSRNKN
jgi:hypothetical protein